MLEAYIPQLILGTMVTLKVAISALILGLLLGMMGALGEMSHHWTIRTCTFAITSLLRGLPELLILFFIYFGGTLILTKLFSQYVEVSAFAAGVVGLALIFAAYASQTLRGAFLAISSGQKQAAQALGLSRWRIFYRILLPQAWRYALPGLSNLWLVLLKDSALVALLGLADLMNITQAAATLTREPFTFYMAAALIYLILTALSQYGLLILEKRAQHP